MVSYIQIDSRGKNLYEYYYELEDEYYEVLANNAESAKNKIMQSLSDVSRKNLKLFSKKKLYKVSSLKAY